MASAWGYEGRRVIVSGGGGAGMGAAMVRHLRDLDAEVHVLDLKEPPVEVSSYQAVDLRDPEASAAAVESIGGNIHALFNCAGLPGSKFPDLDVMLVNFVGMRHLAELVAARMEPGAAIASISSTAGSGYLANFGKWMPLVTVPGFDAAREWCDDASRGDCWAVTPRPKRRSSSGRSGRRTDGRDGHPGQLHQPRPHRDADDARLREVRGQGIHGELPCSARSPLDPGRTGLAAHLLELAVGESTSPGRTSSPTEAPWEPS